MEDNCGIGVITVRVTAVLVTPEKDAVILLFPAATPVDRPVESMLATLESELAQVTWDEMSLLEPSE